MTKPLSTKIALVTGGSRGIGAACVRALAALGADVCAAYRSQSDAAEKTAADARALGVRAIAVSVDIAYEESIKALAKRVKEKLGPVSILINNAGVIDYGPLPFLAQEQWRKVMDSNATGAFLCIKHFAGPMGEARWGRIVNIASAAAHLGDAGRAHYAASKGALLGLTRSAAREWAGRGVTVNAVAPGLVDTDMLVAMTPEQRQSAIAAIPAGRFATPDEVAAAVAFLCTPDAGYITGATLDIDGGLAMG
jgi:3-oxoacyl-[acyl-carrier protein] reductase